MGTAASFHHSSSNCSQCIDKSVKEILCLFPDYQENVILSDHDICSVDESWGMIINDELPHCLNIYEDRNSSDECYCLNYFYDSFFKILYEMSGSNTIEASEGVFSSMTIKSIGNMISAVVIILKNKNMKEFKEKMEFVAITHVCFGVSPDQFPFVCEILVLTLRFCLRDKWEESAKHGWIRLFSYMLDFIVPVAVVTHSSSPVFQLKIGD